MTERPSRLLVVDDDAVNRDLLSRRLVRAGYDVATAASGLEALGRLAQHDVDLVLLDVQMPQMSGLDVLEAIRSTPAPQRVAVLMVTAKDQSDDIVSALERGADDYITKPIDFPVALARIKTQLARKRLEDRSRETEERFALVSAFLDGLWDWKLTANEIYLSPRWKAIVGCEDAEVGTHPDEWFGRVHPADRARLQRDLDAHLSGDTPTFESEYRIRHKNGTYRWVLTRGIAVRDAGGTAYRMAGSQADITEGKVVDAVTGLPNRMVLIDRLERLLHLDRRLGGLPFALLFLDLDSFKYVNDSLGHLAGDELLQAVARRLEHSLRSSDLVARPAVDLEEGDAEHTVARLGGDEFILVLHNVGDAGNALRIAERVQRDLAAPFRLHEREVFTTASIGIAMSTTGYDTPEELLRDADIAMYRAKAAGKGRAEVFDVAMREQAIQRLQLDTAVRMGLERHEFLPFYQPIIDMQTGQLVGFEALLRWRHPQRGLVRPAEFVPVIEENGLLRPIGHRFLDDVFADLSRWRSEFAVADRIWINVNFASQQFLEAGLPVRLLEAIARAGLEPRHLVVEITESTAIGNFALTADVLAALRTAGIRVVLDDFGTGYSSLACLHQLPISGIKLDPTFIGDNDPRPEILQAVVALANSLDLTMTAEGIETARQCARLRALGCDFAQGYLFAEPLSATAAGAVIDRDRSWLPDLLPEVDAQPWLQHAGATRRALRAFRKYGDVPPR
jgi:PAS domain S-box-containing protein